MDWEISSIPRPRRPFDLSLSTNVAANIEDQDGNENNELVANLLHPHHNDTTQIIDPNDYMDFENVTPSNPSAGQVRLTQVPTFHLSTSTPCLPTTSSQTRKPNRIRFTSPCPVRPSESPSAFACVPGRRSSSRRASKRIKTNNYNGQEARAVNANEANEQLETISEEINDIETDGSEEIVDITSNANDNFLDNGPNVEAEPEENDGNPMNGNEIPPFVCSQCGRLFSKKVSIII